MKNLLQLLICACVFTFFIWTLSHQKALSFEDPIYKYVVGEGWEDYTSELKKREAVSDLEFGHLLASELNDQPWLIVDLDRLSKAVARHETASCTKGYGKEYNNCHGIKNGNTAPCPKIGRNRMCIYSDPSESHEAFKKIWSTWYRGIPTMAKARRYSGNDRAHIWLNNVLKFYHQ